MPQTPSFDPIATQRNGTGLSGIYTVDGKPLVKPADLLARKVRACAAPTLNNKGPVHARLVA